MVIGPSEISKEMFDIVVVDESHRLRRRVNLGTYFGAFDKACEKLKLDKNKCSELDWVLKQSKKAIFFYDEGQSIKPSDTRKEDFERLKKEKKTQIQYLKSQLRVKGGNNYVEYIEGLLNCTLDKEKKFYDKQYEFLLFESIADMCNQIKLREKENGLSRLIAGYSWEWISKSNKKLFDIKIENYQLKWNSLADDWINSKDAINEVGCIHTTQGYDLNYAGVIFGNEITYNEKKDEIEIIEKNYFDKNGKQSINKPDLLKAFIINIYKTILQRGIKGTYVYACDKALYKYLSKFIPKFKQGPENKILPKELVRPYVNAVPLYDLKAAAGKFNNLQKVDECDWITLPERYKPSEDLFACSVVGDSMNKVIPSGSICLFKKYSGGSRNGQIILAELIDFQDTDTGSSFIVKEYQSKKINNENGWRHQSIVLKPLSFDDTFKEIVLNENDIDNFKVIGIFECIL